MAQIASRAERPWWRDAVTYQIYPRSFADSNGDGIGDVEGIRSRLPYLKSLGIDAIWISPWYPSPQHDHGYDVSDYMDIEPDYGTLAQAEQLIKDAHDCGIKLIVDIVPNHTSSDHKWFKEAMAASQDQRNVIVTCSVMARGLMEIFHQTTGRLSSVVLPGSVLSKLMESLVSGIYTFLQLNNQI